LGMMIEFLESEADTEYLLEIWSRFLYDSVVLDHSMGEAVNLGEYLRRGRYASAIFNWV
jgi:hypothetical protein